MVNVAIVCHLVTVWCTYTSMENDVCGLDLPHKAYVICGRQSTSLEAFTCVISYICFISEKYAYINTLRPRQNGRHFPDDIFKCIFVNENVSILIKISLKFVPKVLINNIPALVQKMAWRRPGDKPLSETMLVNLLTDICVTRPQWVNVDRQWERKLFEKCDYINIDTQWQMKLFAMWICGVTDRKWPQRGAN